MVSKSSACLNGLERYASIPASRQRCLSDCMAWAVSATTGRDIAAFPHDLDGFVAVHVRHLDIEEHEVESLAFQQGKGFDAVAGHLELGAGFFEQYGHDLLIDGVVRLTRMRTDDRSGVTGDCAGRGPLKPAFSDQTACGGVERTQRTVMAGMTSTG